MIQLCATVQHLQYLQQVSCMIKQNMIRHFTLIKLTCNGLNQRSQQMFLGYFIFI